MKRVLVTGASGFIGRHAAAEFAGRRYEVLAPSSRELDLLDFSRTREFVAHHKPTHLAHFAWYNERGKVWNSPKNRRWTEASAALFRAFAENGGERAFFAGSCAEYRWSDEPLRDDLTTPDIPISEYGRSKRELLGVLGWDPSNVSVAWGRIFFVYGPGEDGTRFVPSILRPLLRGEPAVVRFGDHWRDFLHVEDVARACATLLESSPATPVNIASGTATNLADFGKRIAEFVGRPDLLRIEHGESTSDNPRRIVAGLELLPKTGFTPKYTLDEGIKTLLKTD